MSNGAADLGAPRAYASAQSAAIITAQNATLNAAYQKPRETLSIMRTATRRA